MHVPSPLYIDLINHKLTEASSVHMYSVKENIDISISMNKR